MDFEKFKELKKKVHLELGISGTKLDDFALKIYNNDRIVDKLDEISSELSSISTEIEYK